MTHTKFHKRTQNITVSIDIEIRSRYRYYGHFILRKIHKTGQLKITVNYLYRTQKMTEKFTPENLISYFIPFYTKALKELKSAQIPHIPTRQIR